MVIQLDERLASDAPRDDAAILPAKVASAAEAAFDSDGANQYAHNTIANVTVTGKKRSRFASLT